MHGVVGAVLAGAGIVAEEVDPTVQPVRQSFYAFLFLGVATILLILSLLRHLRRAQTNLGSARGAQDPAGEGSEGAGPGGAPSADGASGADGAPGADAVPGRDATQGDPR